MSDDKDKQVTFFNYIGGLFSSLTLKIKVILSAIIGIFGFISIFLFAKNINQRKILKLELKKVREKIEIEKAQEKIDKNSEVISSLEKEEELILKQIEQLDRESPREDVSKEELDEFFDKRGF
jgi:F420-0:gamma-glutamyl ligase-like protein